MKLINMITRAMGDHSAFVSARASDSTIENENTLATVIELGWFPSSSLV